MNLDTFIISLLFDDKQTQTSATKIENIVGNLSKSIIRGLSTIGTVDFLRGAVNGFKDLSTQLDNLAYITKSSASEIQAWGETVKRNGGTAEGFYTSIQGLAGKLRDIQTSFGSEGQLAFARLGIQLRDNNGRIKNSIELLGDLSTLLKNKRPEWQISIGQQLGLDIPTIRTLVDANLNVGQLVKRMTELGLTTQNNIRLGINYRNTVYDLNLVWLAFKNQLAQAILPLLINVDKVFTYLIEKTNKYKGVIQGLAVGIGVALIPTIVRLVIALSPLLLTWGSIATVVAGVALAFQDVYAGLNGGDSVILTTIKRWNSLYSVVHKVYVQLKQLEEIPRILDNIFSGKYKIFGTIDTTPRSESEVGVSGKIIRSVKSLVNTLGNSQIKSAITQLAIASGVDPSQALTIANIESSLNPNAKSQVKGSTSGGLYGLIDKTGLDNGLDPKDKFNPILNAKAGIRYLATLTKQLTAYLGRKPTGGELYLGEHLGAAGVARLLNASDNTPTSSAMSSEAYKNNTDFQGITAGQLKAKAQNTFNSKAVSVNVGSLNVHSQATNPTQVAQETVRQLSQHVQLVNTYNSGRVL